MSGGIMPPKRSEGALTRTELVEEVFRKYHKKLTNLCARRLIEMSLTFNPTEDAEDIISLVYKKLLASADPIDLKRNEHAVFAYLCKILGNTIKDHFRELNRRKKIPENRLMSLEERFLEKNEAISAKHADKETKITLEQALAELEKSNPRMASIIRQRYEEGRTLTEIGQEYGFTKQAIYQIEEKALEKLRKFMETGKM